MLRSSTLVASTIRSTARMSWAPCIIVEKQRSLTASTLIAGAVLLVAIFQSSSSLAAFPTESTTGVPARWVPKRIYTSNVHITRRGAVLEDVRLVNANLIIDAENVTVRRVEILGGRIDNRASGGPCSNGLKLIRVSIGRGPGQTTRDTDQPVIGTGGYTAIRVKIDGVPEGFRVGGSNSGGCGTTVIRDTFIRVVPPDVCNDWHGDGIQGYDGPRLVVRNTTIHLVTNSRCGGGTAPFFYPHSQGNTSVFMEDVLVRGGGYPFRLGTPGVVRGLRIVRDSWSFGPINVKCSVVTEWDAQIVTISSNYQPTGIVRRLPCLTELGD